MKIQPKSNKGRFYASLYTVIMVVFGFTAICYAADLFNELDQYGKKQSQKSRSRTNQRPAAAQPAQNQNSGNKQPAVTASKEGWCSVTKYKCDMTPIQAKIVELANAETNGGPDISTSYDNGGDAPWLTDVDCDTRQRNGKDCDGQRMRDAIMIYDKWKKGGGKGDNPPTNIKDAMKGKFNKSGYGNVQKDLFVKKIVDVYKQNTTVPSDDESTLKYLGVKKQCLEWAMSIAKKGGIPNPPNYKVVVASSRKSIPLADVRPGMGYYDLGKHAMIIIDVHYDKNGKVDEFKVAESNFPCGGKCPWVNPGGQIPWERKVSNSRKEKNLGYTIINFEK